MFLLQLKYETLRLLRSPAIWLLFIFLLICVCFGLYNGSHQMAASRKSVTDMITTQQTNFENQKLEADSVSRGLKKVDYWWQDPTNVVSVMWWGGLVMAVDPTPKNILASGMKDLQPDAWKLTFTSKEAQGDSEFENPINLAVGSFDLTFVMAFLLPLLVISLSFNLISSEREQGTIALQRSQPVAFGNLFFQKMLARFVLLAGITLLITLPALAWIGVSLTSTAALVTAGTAVLYALFWFLFALGINLRGYSSAHNALLCVGIWLGFTLVIPALINMLAQKVHPVPSRAGFQTALREIKSKVESNREKILDEYYLQHPDATRISEDKLDWYDWNQCKNYYREEFFISTIEKKQIDSLEQRYDGAAQNQADFADMLTLFSPTLSVHRQMTDLAGTSSKTFDAFSATLDEVQQNWTTLFLKKFDADQSLTAADYDKFMQFPSKLVTSGLPGNYYGILLLIFQCLLAGGWVWLSDRRSS